MKMFPTIGKLPDVFSNGWKPAQQEAIALREGRCPQRPFLFLQLIPYFSYSPRSSRVLTLRAARGDTGPPETRSRSTRLAWTLARQLFFIRPWRANVP